MEEQISSEIPSLCLRSGPENCEDRLALIAEMTEFTALALRVLAADIPQGAKDLLAIVGEKKTDLSKGLISRLERLANRPTCEVLERKNIAGIPALPPGASGIFSSDGITPPFSTGGILLDLNSRRVTGFLVPDEAGARSSSVFSMPPGLSRPILCGRGSFRGR